MNWIPLKTSTQLDEINTHTQGYSIIFKHSTRCSISLMAKKMFEHDWDNLSTAQPVFLLDLLKFRELSTRVAQTFDVKHESPQLLIIKNGICIFNASHDQISAEEAIKQLG